MLLDVLDIVDHQPTRIEIRAFNDGICPYILLQSTKFGRVLLVHTDKHGKFDLEISQIDKLFRNNNCDATMTCFPKLHAILHKDLVDKLHIIYLDCDTAIEQNWNYEWDIVTISDERE
jgi:hypothetical protein